MAIGKFFRISPTGSLYRPDPADVKAPPTTLTLGQVELGVGDYIGLQANGAYRAGYQGSTDSSRSMNCAFTGNGRPISPATGSELRAITSQPTCPGGLPTDIPEDFSVPFDAPALMRIPTEATGLSFCPDDCYFRDNTDPNGDYGVYVTRPNSPPVQSSAAIAGVHGLPEDSDEYAEVEEGSDNIGPLPDHDDADLQILTGAATDLRAGIVTKVPDLQYRGWYTTPSGTHVWAPKLSHYMGRTSAHHGIDIFCPRGTPLASPFAGKIRIGNDRRGFGKHAIVSFSLRGVKMEMLIAHLDRLDVGNGNITQGQLVGTAGCSGNAAGTLPCGKPNSCGGRSDHFHLEVTKGPWRKTATRLNIVSEWGVPIKYQDSKDQLLCV